MERYEAYKDSGVPWIGEIPEGWEVVRLKYYLLANDGGVWGDDPNMDGYDTIVLRSTEQTADGKWNIEEPALRCLADVQQIERVLLRENDLLMTKSSGSALHIGKTTLVNEEVESMRCAYSNFMQRIRVRLSEVPRYYWYLLNSGFVRCEYEYLQNSTSGLGNLSAGLIGELILPRCQSEEQQAIADFLDEKTAEIDGIVSETERSIELLREYRKSVISEAVIKGLDPDTPMKDSGIEWIGEIPEGWKIRALKHFVCAIGSGTSVEGAKWPALPGDEGVLTLSAVYQGVFHPNENKAVNGPDVTRLTCPVVKGSLLVSRCNTSEWVGTAAFVKEDAPGLYLPDKLWQLEFDSEYMARFVQYSLHSKPSRTYFEVMSVGASQTMQNISKDDLLNVPLPMPTETSLHEIVDYLDTRTAEIDALISNKEKQVELLKEYRKSLISEVVTGKFKVPGVHAHV